MIFGGIVCAAGFIGVILGSSLAQYFRNLDGRADPLVCAGGIFVAIPFTFYGLANARSETTISWILLFFSVTALSTNWAVVSDMLLSVTLPNKRAFATAIQILISHLFGDATSPFIVGSLKDELENYKYDEFSAFLYALLSTLVILFLGAITFLYSSRFFVQDVATCRNSLIEESERDGPARTDAANLTDFATLA